MASFRERLKDYGREALGYTAQAASILTPGAATAAAALYGPAGGLAVTGLSRPFQQYAASSGARGRGERGHEARMTGRAAVRRTTTYALAGTALGTIGAGVVGGWSAAGTGLLGSQQLGIAGTGTGLFGLSNPFVTAPADSVEKMISDIGPGSALVPGSGLDYEHLARKGMKNLGYLGGAAGKPGSGGRVPNSGGQGGGGGLMDVGGRAMGGGGGGSLLPILLIGGLILMAA